MNTPTPPFIWQGRTDTEEVGDSRRWHHQVRPFDSASQGGVALIGFIVVVIEILIGVLLGGIAGYFGNHLFGWMKQNGATDSASLFFLAGCYLLGGAIVSLITGSVPGLDARKVSVVDQSGKLLTGDLYDDAPIGKETDKKLAFIQKLERNIEQRAAIMLLPILGEGNYRIQVSSDVDFSVVEETREAIDPASVVRSESIKTDTMQDQLAMGIPGSLANQPPLPADQQGGDDNQRTSERNESSRQFDNGRAVTHTKFEVGRLKSMSVSVLVNEAGLPVATYLMTVPEDVVKLRRVIEGREEFPQPGPLLKTESTGENPDVQLNLLPAAAGDGGTAGDPSGGDASA